MSVGLDEFAQGLSRQSVSLCRLFFLVSVTLIASCGAGNNPSADEQRPTHVPFRVIDVGEQVSTVLSIPRGRRNGWVVFTTDKPATFRLLGQKGGKGDAVSPVQTWPAKRSSSNVVSIIVDYSLPKDALPDGERINSNLLSAWLTEPTTRYRHGVLGDDIEAAGMAVSGKDRAVIQLDLPPNSVFEDRYPRLADIDGDGQDDVVVVRSYLDAGAAVSVWTLRDGQIVSLGESPSIGRPNRWLNPAGIADFDGDGRVEIAAVITPHIGGTLKLYELRDGRLVEEAAEPGFSNHEIGSRVLGMSAVVQGHPDGPVLAVPDTRRTALRIVAFHGGRFAEWHRIAHDSAIATDIVAHDLNGDGRDELVYALKDGRLIVVDGDGVGAE